MIILRRDLTVAFIGIVIGVFIGAAWQYSVCY
jgi:hypothetical protein